MQEQLPSVEVEFGDEREEREIEDGPRQQPAFADLARDLDGLLVRPAGRLVVALGVGHAPERAQGAHPHGVPRLCTG